MATTASPIGLHERYDARDLLRGVALLGILVMNIQSFAMPMAAYYNPTALGTLTYGARQPLRRDRHSSRDWPQISTDAS